MNQVKVYIMFFERHSTDMAKIALSLETDNCAAQSLTDSSYDVENMVRAGHGLAGENLCARLNVVHLPTGASRRAHVFAYYSADTAMR